MNPLIVTVSSEQQEPGLLRLLKSISRFKWRAAAVHLPWIGFKTKLIGVRSVLITAKRAGHDCIVFTDAFDTLALAGPEVIEQHFDGTGALISCEKAVWPDPSKAPLYPPNPKSEWCYINSGGYIAEIDFLGDVLLEGCDKAEDDQLFLTEKFLTGNPLIRRDDGCNLFQTLAHCYSWPHQHWSDTFELVDGRVRNKVTNTMPAFVHGNGRTDISWINI